LSETFDAECPATSSRITSHLDILADISANIGALILYYHMSPY